MKLAFAGKQAFTQQDSGALQGSALGEVGLIGDQNFPHQIGMVDQVDMLRAEPEIRQVAVLARHLHQEPDRMGSKRGQMAQDR
jgi:hypothetical protein